MTVLHLNRGSIPAVTGSVPVAPRSGRWAPPAPDTERSTFACSPRAMSAPMASACLSTAFVVTSRPARRASCSRPRSKLASLDCHK